MKTDLIWHSETRLVKDLKPFENNPRQANQKEYDDLKKSIDKFNVAEPLVINLDNTVIGGNFRKNVLDKSEIKEVQVQVPNRALTKEEANELNIRLNKNQGRWDFNILANFGEELLLEAGFEENELQIFMEDFSIPNVDIKGEIKEGEDYLVLTFTDKKEYLKVHKKLDLNENTKVITFKEFVKKYGEN